LLCLNCPAYNSHTVNSTILALTRHDPSHRAHVRCRVPSVHYQAGHITNATRVPTVAISRQTAPMRSVFRCTRARSTQ